MTLRDLACRAAVLIAAVAFVAHAPRCAAVGAAGDVHLPPGFRAELVYTVPLDTQGSWVSLAVDERGRLIASDQNGALYRLTPAPGDDPSKTKVEPIPLTFGMAHGLLCHDGKLYVVMNGQIGSFTSGLYRLSDSDKDDKYDRLEHLRMFNGAGEHGPHAVLLGPDSKSLYFVCGNFTALPRFDRSLVPPVWQEDQLLPRLYDPMGHANEIKAPGGWIARSDLDGNNMELVSVGYRNCYDMAFNADGELFTFDSDMEWDIGAPWYRPTRICHVVSGSDFGWRSGNGAFPSYYPDTLPPVVEVGQGSPTGMTFGGGAKFPSRYQQALFCGDWSCGNIYAIHLAPAGATYRAEVERFASAMPLAVTDIVVRPQDGALYFAVGGRQSESAVYRIVWSGDESQQAEAPTLAAPTPEQLAAAKKARELRLALEARHRPANAADVERIWPYLGSADRVVRYAARVALEQQPTKTWHSKALAEPDADIRLRALVALARTATPDEQAAWLDALKTVSFAEAPHGRRLTILRAIALGFMRFPSLSSDDRKQLVDAFDKHFPTGDHEVDRELAALLVRLEAPAMVERLLAQLQQAATQEEAIDVAITLSAIRNGWTTAQRGQLLDWFDASAKLGGGRSTFGYIVAARERFIASFPIADRDALAKRILQPLVAASAPLELTSRPFVREWKLDELVQLVEQSAAPRKFHAGRRMFSAASCYNCHRIAGEGSSVGPDLTTVGRRFGVRDLMRAIVEPSHEISDQYQQMVFVAGGKTYVGRITNVAQQSVSISTDMLDPKKSVEIPRIEIEEQRPSDISVMPAGLLNTLSAEEVLDLTAFLRAGGDAQSTFFSNSSPSPLHGPAAQQ
jgi:putative heme-binding domain-containing protein